MKKLLAAVTVLAVSTARVCLADFVTSAVAVSGPTPVQSFVWERTIDQSGLSDNYVSGVTDFDTYVGLSPTHIRNNDPANYAASFGHPPLNIDYELGVSSLVTQLALWNYPFPESGGIVDFDVFTAQSADFVDAVFVGSFAASDDGDDVINSVQVFDLLDSAARYVRIHVLTTAAPVGTGLSEVAFATFSTGCLAVTSQEVVCHTDGTTFTVNVEGLNACTGGTSMFTFTGSGGAVGEEMCFTLLVDDGGFCCSTEICVTIPDCTPAALPSDLNGDGLVGIEDFLALLDAWGSCSDCGTCPADFDGECSVGILDLLILLGNWG